MAEQIAQWQRRLEAEGRVRIRRSPWLFVMMIVFGVLLGSGPLVSIVHDGPTFWSVVGFLFFGVLCVGSGVAGLVSDRPGATVAADGLHLGRRVLPFADIEAVRAQRKTLIIDHRPMPGEKLYGPQRRSGLKQHGVSLYGARGAAGDLATWLLMLKGGAGARVDRRRHGRFEVYTLAETPWWEQPPGE